MVFADPYGLSGMYVSLASDETIYDKIQDMDLVTVRLEDPNYVLLTDALVTSMQALSVELIPMWRGSVDDLSDIPTLQAFVANKVGKYGNGGSMPGLAYPITHWQVGNEWNGAYHWDGTKEEFLQYLNVVSTQIKTTDPLAKVILGGISALQLKAFVEGYIPCCSLFWNGRNWNKTQIQAGQMGGVSYAEYSARIEYILNYGDSYIDYVDFHHYYANYDYLSGKIACLQNYTAKPFCMTEIGFKEQIPEYIEIDSQLVLADALNDTMRDATGLGAELMLWHGIKDGTLELANITWGLLKSDAFINVEKPAYQTMKNVIAGLGGW